MKKYIIIYLISIFYTTLIFAQNTPPGIAYQAVAIKDGPHSLGGQNASTFNWSSKDIQVRFSIFDQYPGGSVQYSEAHSTKTDEFGVFNLIIGQGKTISGIFDNIPWELGTAHLQVEIDFENNNNFKVTSFERFWSVPYAFVTRKSKGLNTDSAINSLNNKFTYLKNRDKDTVIGNEGGVTYKSLDSLNKALKAQIAKLKLADKDTIIGNEWQNLSIKKDSLLISNGKGIKLLDNDSLNEIQKLNRFKDTVSLSKNGGKFVLNDDDPKNELQDILISGDTIKLTKSNSSIKISQITNSSSKFSNQISETCSNNTWIFAGGGGGGSSIGSSYSNVCLFNYPRIVQKDTACFGDFACNYKTGESVYFPIASPAGLQNAPGYIFQDSIIIACGYNYNFSKPRTVNIISFPQNKMIYDMDATYPGHSLTSYFKDIEVKAMFYFKDTLAIISQNSFICFCPRTNKTIKVITGQNNYYINGFFQIDNKKFILKRDSLFELDYNFNLIFRQNLDFVDLRPEGNLISNQSKVCIPISKKEIFIVNSHGRGHFLEIDNFSAKIFSPRFSLFNYSCNYFFDGKYIYHTRSNSGQDASYQPTGNYFEKIQVK
jgi:hypothetical protein